MQIKHTCKDCIHFKICNDYENLVGREDKVACPDYKSTEDVVPKSEVEHWKEEANRYQTLWCKTYNDFEISELITEAKQEVAREIFKEIETLIPTTNDYNDTSNWFAFIDQLEELISKLKKKYIGE